MIYENQITSHYNELKSICGGVKEDYFALVYLLEEMKIKRDKAVNQISFGGNDYGLDAFHFDEERKNLYLYQFKYSKDTLSFKNSFLRLIDIGLARIFTEPNKDSSKNEVLTQLRSCLINNAELINQVCFHFVFLGDASAAEKSKVLDKLREDLENKKYLVDDFFKNREVGFVVEFRSANGKVGGVTKSDKVESFHIPMEIINTSIAGSQKLYIGFIRLKDLHSIYLQLGWRFFDSNIRFGLGDNETVNRALSRTLKDIIIDENEDPSIFAFNHNGVTLYSSKVESKEFSITLRSPRLLNGAQTVSIVSSFLDSNKDNQKLQDNADVFEKMKVLCKIISEADEKFITRVTINNNRQNPVEPWNLHANDIIQCHLQDKFSSEVEVYYERQKNAFDQLNVDELNQMGVKEESKSIEMLKLTQTFILTDGNISRMSEIKRIFEEDALYEQVFCESRLNIDSRKILLCYKIQFRLGKVLEVLKGKNLNKLWFVKSSRNLLWALLCQGILNDKRVDVFADSYGTNLSIPYAYTEILIKMTVKNMHFILTNLLKDDEFSDKVKEENPSFLKNDKTFMKCMLIAKNKYGWKHIKLK